MPLKYKDGKFAQNRLVGTIVRLNEEPVYVTGLDPYSGMSNYKFLGSIQSGIVSDYNDYDLTPVPLGNCNISNRKRVSYLFRTPMREDWRQGLRENNLRTHGYQPGLTSADMAQTIKGNYPDVEYCMKLLGNGEFLDMAFGRNFSLTPGKGDLFAVRFRNNKWVGRMARNIAGGVHMEFDSGWEYLDEMLKQEIK